ncbi:MAG: hypothetical protein AVDCRST_MAG03-2794, partial [uncultured Rubrobacteraceae bacterium]
AGEALGREAARRGVRGRGVRPRARSAVGRKSGPARRGLSPKLPSDVAQTGLEPNSSSTHFAV